MALQNNDLLIVGRGQNSYTLTYNEVKTEINADIVALVEAEEARATAAETLLKDNIDAEEAARIAGDATEKARAEAAEAQLQSNIDAEETRAKAAEQALSDALSQEAIDRAEGDATINTRIDNLVLNDLANVTVAGATDNQVLYYNEAAGEWQAKVITLSSSLDYAGDIDLTAAAPTVEAGALYVNTTTSGAVDASFGTAVQEALPNGVSGGEFVAFNGTDWAYVGSIGGGLTYDSFTVNNETETGGSKGELAYNSSNGTFTFTKVDLDSRIPKDLGTLPVLPA